MEIVRQTFDRLLKSVTIEEVERILDDIKVDKKHRMGDSAYPKLKFNITKEEIAELKEKGIVTENNLLSDIFNADTLTKLLYALSWKNGDLKKIKHIIEGITSGQKNEKENGLVFYQFGKYLTKEPGEPIIDQNVLRAFGVFKADGDIGKINKLKRLSVITKREKGLIEQYKLWLRTALKSELRDNENYSYYVDKVLFAVGKSIKRKGGEKDLQAATASN